MSIPAGKLLRGPRARNAIAEARARYRPRHIRVVFIAEAPPAYHSGRFFYFEQVNRDDWLYVGLMRVLFDDACDLDVRRLRRDKLDYLARFREAGYYLIDASDVPMPSCASPAVKRRHLQVSLDALLRKTRELASPDTRVVLISRNVFEVCYAPLKGAGLRVVNNEMIDFPSSGRQAHFARKLRVALSASDEYLQSTIRGLEASLDYFGAGEVKKRERERWIVEHFLRGLGLTFEPLEIEQPRDNPPDARFRGAAFEVKEIQQPGRRRGDEYRQALKRAKSAINGTELIEGVTPQSLAIADAWRLVMEQTRELAARKYVRAADRRGLDLLFYLNLGMRQVWDIEDGERPDLAPLIAEGWRSVSFLKGYRTACVMSANAAAPDFLYAARGQLIIADN